MTTQRLRDLMEERVADVETDDLASRAWARADGVRRRRRIAVTGTAVAAVLAVARRRCTRGPARLQRAVPERGPDHDDVAARADRRRRGSARRPRGRVPRRPVLVGAARRARLRAPGPPGARHPRRAVDGRRPRTPTSRRTTWTRCSAGQAAVPPVRRRGSCRSTCRTGSVRWPTRAATSSARSDQGCLARRHSGVLPAARARRGLGPADATPGGPSMTADSRGGVDPGRAIWACTRPYGPTGPVGPRRPPVVVAGRGAGGTAAELDWMAEGARRRSASEPGSLRQPRVPGRRRPAAPELLAFGDGPEQDAAARRWRGSATTSCCSPPRRPTAPTGCWPGGSAPRPLPGQRVHRPPAAGVRRPAGPRTPSASGCAR